MMIQRVFNFLAGRRRKSLNLLNQFSIYFDHEEREGKHQEINKIRFSFVNFVVKTFLCPNFLVQSAPRPLILMSGLALLFGGCQSNEPAHKAQGSSVTIRIVHGPELRSVLSSVRERFLSEHPVLNDGTSLALQFTVEPSVNAARKISRGEIKAEAWIASSSSLVNFANANLSGLGAKQVDCVPLFSSPIVIATQARFIEHFSPRGRIINWHALFDQKLSGRERGPAESTESSAMAYSHALPDASTTGLDALIQLGYQAVHQVATNSAHQSLSVQAIRSDVSLKALQQYEDLVSGYSLSEGYLLERAAEASARRVRFVITTEQQMALFNLLKGGPDAPLQALYFEDGTHWQDYQLCISSADWVAPMHRSALRLFSQFLLGPEAQGIAQQRGFRSSRPDSVRVAPLTEAYGVRLELPTLSYPAASGEVVGYLLEAWPQLMRPAAAAFVLDRSGSMEGEALRLGRDNFRNLIARMPSRDFKALISFSTMATIDSPFTHDPGTIIQALDRAQALGGSSVYDAIRQAIELSTAAELKPYRKSIVVLTDGEDKNSESSLQGLLDVIGNKFLRHDINLMIVVSEKEGADYTDLQRIAKAANGLYRQGPAQRLPVIFNEVLKNL